MGHKQGRAAFDGAGFAKPPESGYNLGFAKIRPVVDALAGALS
jgi:hypothetical protein